MGIMLSVIMDEFGERKMFDPCFRVGSAIDSQVHFQFLVEAFSLSIGLRMISGRGCNGVIKEFSKSFREFGDELRALVRDNLVVESKSAVNMLEEKFCYALRGDSFQARSNTITPFIRLWSTTTIIESSPLEGGRSVMRSTDKEAKGTVASEEIGTRGGVTGWVSAFIC
jgi:hypothetical protein